MNIFKTLKKPWIFNSLPSIINYNVSHHHGKHFYFIFQQSGKVCPNILFTPKTFMHKHLVITFQFLNNGHEHWHHGTSLHQNMASMIDPFRLN